MMLIINVNSHNTLVVIYRSNRIAFHDVYDHSWLWRHITASSEYLFIRPGYIFNVS